MNSLKTAPFKADTLFGGRIQAAVTADREDQIHASLASSNVGPRPGPFKRPASKSPAQGLAAKKAKKNTFLNRRSSIPPPAPRSSPPFLPPPPPMQEIPVGARLLHFKQRWLQITSDAWVLSLVSRGLSFQFERRPAVPASP